MTTEQKFDCIFCKDVFNSKEELQIHFRKHGDPQFNSRSRFSSDVYVSDKKSNDKTEMVSCDVCSLMFPTISKAITHKHKVHPEHDVKYFCPWCGKLFTMKHPYNVHVQSSHESQEPEDNQFFHCDCCDVDFFLPAAMKYHNKFFHQQDTDIIDVGMSKKLKMINQEVIPIYYCAFCGEEFDNKVNLLKHLNDDHSDENQSPDEVLRCPLCEAIFYHLDAYEIHLSYHSTEDMYSQENELFQSLLDFSLETVPPVKEKVENREDAEPEIQSHDSDAVSNANAIEIESFLELAMDQAENSNSSKVKKKKHKKSKKAAITLDEFLSMNQDVFGEDLNFHGVEELPTRIVKKRVRNSKKSMKAETSAEVEKLKEKGIVVMKVGASKSIKAVQKKEAMKPPPNSELRTSSEVLTKLMNQSNNQIKIVKKSVPVVNNEMSKTNENIDEENEFDILDKMKKNTENSSVEDAENESVERDNVTPYNETISTVKADDLSTLSLKKIPSDTDMPHKESDATVATKEFNCTSNQNIDEETPSTNDTILENVLQSHDSSSARLIQNKYLEPSEEAAPHEPDYEEPNSDMVIRDDIDNQHLVDRSNYNNHSESDKRPLANSLSTLKHLSHLTIKPVNQSNKTSELPMENVSNRNESAESNIDEEQAGLNHSSGNEVLTSKQKPSADSKDTAAEALKVLSKNITIKSLPKSAKRSVSESDIEEELDDTNKITNNLKLKEVSSNKNITIKKIKTELSESTHKAININHQSVTTDKMITSSQHIQARNNNVDDTTNNPSKTNAHILKNLPNITSKAVPPKKMVNEAVKQPHEFIKITPKENEIIEISDIDSDNECDYPEPKPDTTFVTNPLKNLSKHITVKSLKQSPQPILKNIKLEKAENHTDEDFEDNLFDSDDVPTIGKACGQKLSSKSFVLHNTLKNLGKNITIKSGTSSPSQLNKSIDHYQHDDSDEAEGDLDAGKVKITEIEDENLDNHDDYQNNSNETHDDNQPIIESPHDSFSENDEADDDMQDFETEIHTSTVFKTNEVTTNKNTLCLNNLKNINKNLTIKTLSSNFNSTDTPVKSKPTLIQENRNSINNQTTQSPNKPNRHLIKEPGNEETSTKLLKKAPNFVDHTAHESSNQQQSVNKEVTVKTFQTKTVIEEITTTVTKTIKTVNQTVKQEAKNTNQMNIPVMPQRVQGMKPSMCKNLQGVVIRQAGPTTVTSNNCVNKTRPGATIVRPKQTIPTRPGLNITKPSIPKTPNAKSNLPKCSPNKQVIGKTLKVSPSALVSTTPKRSNTEDANGPFSCFKKPKESLIPGTEMPLACSGDTMLMKAASTSSNYMSTSKMVKGNTVVTATQIKSEMSSSTQQLNRLSGTKVKCTQVKQSQVQMSEISSRNQTTLDAIERLQKQGLLVKKPRIEVGESNYSDGDA